MELTLWNQQAVGTDFQVGQVVFLKKAGLAVAKLRGVLLLSVVC